jgi:antitoxin VapB
MTLTIESDEVDRLAEALAARTRVGKMEAVKLALENELRRLDAAQSVRQRIRPIQDRIMARPPTGLEADKAFYDWLSDES